MINLLGRTRRFAPTVMKYNPDIHHRRSIRLKGYNYSQAGWYFVTICTQHHECLFGNIVQGEMNLNDAGRMVKKWYLELENKFSDVRCLEYVIMPNHFHAIIQNIGIDRCVSTDRNKQGEYQKFGEHQEGEHIGSPLQVEYNHSIQNVGADLRVCPSPSSHLSHVIQWFKTMSTNYIKSVKTQGWKRFNGQLWQRNYYEHIIRDEIAHDQILEYIINNPLRWEIDKYYVS